MYQSVQETEDAVKKLLLEERPKEDMNFIKSNNVWREWESYIHNLTNYMSKGLEVRVSHGTTNEPSLSESIRLFWINTQKPLHGDPRTSVATPNRYSLSVTSGKQWETSISPILQISKVKKKKKIQRKKYVSIIDMHKVKKGIY